MPVIQPYLTHRAEMLLDFWFTPERASEPNRLRDIRFQATVEFDARPQNTSVPITTVRRQVITSRGAPRRTLAWL